jgi:tetratricopeptide (TPR) repeat protein
MSKQRSKIGASLVAAALAAFSVAPSAFGAGGQNSGGGGGQMSGGSERSGGGFSGGHIEMGHGDFGRGDLGHSGSAFAGSGSTRPLIGENVHSNSVSRALAPSSGSHFPPEATGSPATTPPITNPNWSHGGTGWQAGINHWNNGQWYRNHWNWFGNGNFYAYPYYIAFVPLLYGGYGYGYPYFDYGGANAYYALYYNGDDGLPPVNLPQAADPGPPIGAGANAAPPNAGGGAEAVADAGNADADNADGSAGAEFFTQAEAAFQDGRYRDALKLANHAAVESPRNPKAHELMSLSLFALADYRGAAIEAHAAIALGPIADWATLFGYYGDQARYTTQLRALEKYSHEKPNSAEARFLRAYHYLMTGHIDAAKEQLTEAVKLTPADKLAADLLKKYSGDVAAPPPPGAVPAAPQGAPAKPANPDPDSFDT